MVRWALSCASEGWLICILGALLWFTVAILSVIGFVLVMGPTALMTASLIVALMVFVYLYILIASR